MRLGLRRRIALLFGLFAAVLLVLTLLPLGVLLSREHSESLREELLEVGETAARSASGSRTPDAAALSARFGRAERIGAWVLNADARPLAPPTHPNVFPARPAGREIDAAAQGDPSVASRVWRDGRRLYAGVPVISRGQVVGILWLTVSERPALVLNRRTWAALGGVGAVVLVLAALGGSAMAARLTRRLGQVVEGARAFGRGDLSERIPLRGADEVTEVARSLNEMAARIEEAMTRQHEFVAAASHQLRTPLTSIRLRIDEMRDIGLGDPLSEEYLEEMGQEVARLQRLTVQLLALFAADSPNEPEAVSVGRAIEEATARVAPLARHREVRVEVEAVSEGVVVAAPPGALEEVLLNVLDNAVKYSPVGGRVTVTSHPEGSSVSIVVSDRGPGLAPDAFPRAFDAFFRARSGSGFGLGLAIAQRICEGAGARISLGPRDGGGTVARIDWPVHGRLLAAAGSRG